MRILSIITIALFLVLLPSHIAKAQETKSFVSKEGGFSIDFPDKPEKSENELKGLIKGKLYTFSVTKNNLSFSLTYTDCEGIDHKATANKEVIVYSVAGGFLESKKGDLLGAIKTHFNSFIGRSIKIRSNDKLIFYRVYYVDDKKDRLYQVSVTINKKDVSANEETILNFLNSFKLLDSQGVAITNQENNLLTNPDPSSPKQLTSNSNSNSITNINTSHNTNISDAASPSLDTNIVSAGVEGIKTPQITQKTKPKYTEKAKANSVEGIVILSAVFRRNATMTDIKIINSLGYGLDEEAIKAALLIKFTPGEKDGKTVNVRARLEFTFSLL